MNRNETGFSQPFLSASKFFEKCSSFGITNLISFKLKIKIIFYNHYIQLYYSNDKF